MEKIIDVNIMVAIAREGRIIGNSRTNSLPGWNLMDDRIHMNKTTTGHVIFCGRPTFESYPDKYRPLPKRYNIILSQNKSYTPDPTNDMTEVCHSFEDALLLADELATANAIEIFCFGGEKIYRQVLAHPMVHVKKLYLTEIEGSFEGDIVFPELNIIDWREIAEPVYYPKSERNSHDFTIRTFSHFPVTI